MTGWDLSFLIIRLKETQVLAGAGPEGVPMKTTYRVIVVCDVSFDVEAHSVPEAREVALYQLSKGSLDYVAHPFVSVRPTDNVYVQEPTP